MATTYTNMGLKSWNAGADLFSYADLDANWAKIANHDHTSGNGVQVPTDGIADNAITSAKILNDTIVNADINSAAAIVGTKLAANTITNDKIATADLQKLGLSDSVVRRGFVSNAGVGTRTNVAYGALSDAADQVSNVVLPTNGLIFVAYQGLWKSDVGSAGRAAVFLGANQIKRQAPTAPAVQETQTGVGVNYCSLSTSYHGLYGQDSTGPDYASDVTTGQIFWSGTGSGNPAGGVLALFAAAGTYTVSVQYRATSGTVSAKERKMWVWTMGF